jgi:hypothetical protein
MNGVLALLMFYTLQWPLLSSLIIIVLLQHVRRLWLWAVTQTCADVTMEMISLVSDTNQLMATAAEVCMHTPLSSVFM